MSKHNRGSACFVVLFAIYFSLISSVFGQTAIQAPKNPYPTSEDIKLGQQAARQAEQQFPLLNIRRIDEYIADVGNRLVDAAPRQFQHPEFHFSYKVVNVKDLNAFALPGGYTYVNRGLIEVAKTEGELAGVMAHEISHVLLRHGTAQYAKAQKVGIWAGIAAIGGAILGGQAGAAAAQGAFGVYFLRYSREYERQADLLGAQIMAKAGYDPRDLANIFRTLEQEGGKSGPEFLSDHPNPGNRYDYIMREAQALRVADNRSDNVEFHRIQAEIREMPYASSRGRTATRSTSRPGDLPSRNFEVFTSDDDNLRVEYPSNWQVFTSDNHSVTFAPPWAVEGSEVTRGIIVGYLNLRRGGDLNAAMDDLIAGFRQSNNYLREENRGRYQETVDGRRALAAYLSGRNASGSNVRMWCVVSALSDRVVYVLSIAPNQEFSQYQEIFSRVLQRLSFR